MAGGTKDKGHLSLVAGINAELVLNIMQTFSLPTDAHNVKEHRVIKTF